ncbi:hypothetical protein RUM43_013438 [Polyplax serrata]|uniref:CBF1-interacting co-repressor CIR N-terminal domain-containing protein n=1 Tax=Polyplax serrata TaxID=468196 RepID=A0AAN8S9M9_POLSC
MNILPKKRWHVRTKDNIARVRRDEAQAAEEEKKKQKRIQIAEREARAEALRKKAREEYGTYVSEENQKQKAVSNEIIFTDDKHVNLFYELEQNNVVSNKTNEEYEKEKKEEREKYEKQIGYLTYLGQDTNELTGNVSWYNKSREERNENQEEVSKRQKIFEDPLVDIRKYLGCDGVKKIQECTMKTGKVCVKTEKISHKRKQSSSGSDHKHKQKKHKNKEHHKKKKKKKKKYNRQSSESEGSSEETEVPKPPNVDLERLRAERLKRELEERRRANDIFARLNGVTVKKEESPTPQPVQKYNSQFNPHLAKQNYL